MLTEIIKIFTALLVERSLTNASLSRTLVAILAHTSWSLNQVTTGSVHVTHFPRACAVSCNNRRKQITLKCRLTSGIKKVSYVISVNVIMVELSDEKPTSSFFMCHYLLR